MNSTAEHLAVKIVVAGGFSVGKTTMVKAISDIEPLSTEADLTMESVGVDEFGASQPKASTTVALDFGRVSLDPGLTLYLFGAPGQERFRFMWDELIRGSVGAVVLVDTLRLADCFSAVTFFENARIPFVVAINTFDNVLHHHPDDVRKALGLSDSVPVVISDARERESVSDCLVALVEHAIVSSRSQTHETPHPSSQRPVRRSELLR